jgi:hypothetical protein
MAGTSWCLPMKLAAVTLTASHHRTAAPEHLMTGVPMWNSPNSPKTVFVAKTALRAIECFRHSGEHESKSTCVRMAAQRRQLQADEGKYSHGRICLRDRFGEGQCVQPLNDCIKRYAVREALFFSARNEQNKSAILSLTPVGEPRIERQRSFE